MPNIQNNEYTVDDLRFLYEIDGSIFEDANKRWGRSIVDRFLELRSEEEKRKDLSLIFDCDPCQISFSKDEFLKANEEGISIVCHWGSLDLDEYTDIEDLKLPKEMVRGYLSLDGVTDIKDKVFTKVVYEYFSVSNATNIERSHLPEKVGGSCFLGSLTKAKDLILPQEIGWGSPDYEAEAIGYRCDIGKLEDGENIFFPEVIYTDFILPRMTRAKGVIFPRSIKGRCDFGNLTNIENSILSEEIEGHCDMSRLTNVKNTIMPRRVWRDFYLYELFNDDGGLARLEYVGGSVYLYSLRRYESLSALEEVGGTLALGGLDSVDGIGKWLKKIHLNSKSRKRSGAEVWLPEYFCKDIESGKIDVGIPPDKIGFVRNCGQYKKD